MLRSETLEKLIESKSEKWQDSETGTQYITWKSQFDDLDPIEVRQLEKIDEVNDGEEVALYMEQNINSDVSDM